MMTDEAIQDVRDFCGKAWTEYREQAPMHEIMRMSTLLPILLAHIDSQASQIATLKVALIRKYAIAEFTRYGIFSADEWDDIGEDYQERHIAKAKDQLANEYPEILWEDQV